MKSPHHGFYVLVCRSTIISLLLLLAGCQPHLPETARSGLVYCSEGSPESFNPQRVTSGTTIDIISQQLYDRLVDINPANGDIIPGLASDWQVSTDGTRYEFILRQDVAFHTTRYFSPSRKFNAEDVVFTFNRITDTEHPFHLQGGGVYPYFQSVDWAGLVKQVLATDQHTVVFELQRPDSSFLSNLTTDFAAILSAEYGQKLLGAGKPGEIDRLPIGTGPFRFREYQKDILVRLYRNDDYWRGDTQPEQLVFDIVPNNARRMAKLFTHECDIVSYPRVAELELIAARPDVTVQESTSMNVGFWAFNTQKPPFDQLAVRQALAMAINRAAILQAVYYGQATPAYGILPPTSWAYNDGLPAPLYSPAKARALLAEAGYPNGFTMDIWAMPVQRLYNPNALKMAELMQADLAQIGVKANIVSYEWNSFRQKLGNFEHDSVLIGWAADNPDPDNFFRPLLSCAARDSGSNRANWCDPAFDDIISQALLTANQQQRRALYLAAQQYLHQKQPLVAIAHSQRFQAISSSVTGVSINPYGGIALQHAKRVEP
ncbi:MAG: ABC transporter substrate-binding protein [Rheinheimera sp.]|uniref:ABC transporter substrate-binding protein n=1 Tax=Arsukibacterium sp. UBA3155 TaxID=1946058 RepID=UPI000C9487D2|nr:ABC transporter substrate-binding protein [Arsukibacterium sp. UBA3155]MAD77211.1 ABC transporter substrate-binding protein [Rheinheimera sp.]|tara:strand:- start:15414 stop:17051 length:1638 start_codon:yes stop_codon:yes gene_type:complete